MVAVLPVVAELDVEHRVAGDVDAVAAVAIGGLGPVGALVGVVARVVLEHDAVDAADLPDDLDRYLDDRFYLKRNLWNRVAKLTWYSPRLNHLVYFSKASSALHKVMYSIREKPDELSARGVDWQ